MARLGQWFVCTQSSLLAVTTVTDSEIGMQVS
jgi:hypothetical protein